MEKSIDPRATVGDKKYATHNWVFSKFEITFLCDYLFGFGSIGAFVFSQEFLKSERQNKISQAVFIL